MEIRTIITFLRIAELMNFSKAAEQLGYSQATVTVQIKQLEQELDTQLFERIGKRVKLTEQGEQFIPYAREFLQAAQKAKSFVHQKENPSGKLRIGTAESLFLSVLMPILMEYHQKFPSVEISIHTGLISELFEMVRQNDVDVLFFLDKKTDFPEWIKVLERQEPIIFVSSSTHPFSNMQKIPLEKMLEEPFVLTEKGVSYRYDLEQLLASKGMEIHPFLETGNTDVITKVLLSWNTCMSFLPQYAVQNYLDCGKLKRVDVEDFSMQMWSQLVYHRNKWMTPQMRQFIALMQERIV